MACSVPLPPPARRFRLPPKRPPYLPPAPPPMPSSELLLFLSNGESESIVGSPSDCSNSSFVSVSLWSETSKSSMIGSSSVSSSISSSGSSGSSISGSGACSIDA